MWVQNDLLRSIDDTLKRIEQKLDSNRVIQLRIDRKEVSGLTGEMVRRAYEDYYNHKKVHGGQEERTPDTP